MQVNECTTEAADQAGSQHRCLHFASTGPGPGVDDQQAIAARTRERVRQRKLADAVRAAEQDLRPAP
ncbi:hypothetical protein, partial [Variovorax sp. YR752]|uniref:hypothetical protein n=1 Tax=Variovorax sp. YR752 TaxID=1884383 RepID=UPI0031377488